MQVLTWFFSNFSLCCRNSVFKCMTVHHAKRIPVNFSCELYFLLKYSCYLQFSFQFSRRYRLLPIRDSCVNAKDHASDLHNLYVWQQTVKTKWSGLNQQSWQFKLCLALKIIWIIRMCSSKTRMQIHRCNNFLNCKRNWWDILTTHQYCCLIAGK